MKIRIIIWLILLGCWITVEGQSYRIGDLYTAPDGRQGIVYHLHPDGSGGWVVALNDASTSCAWGDNVDVPTLPDQNLIGVNFWLWHLRTDTAGYAHTQAIRAFQNNSSFAAGTVDFANGWVLPSPAQLNILYGQLPFIETAITNAGGTTLSTDSYWCSAEANLTTAWCVKFFEGCFVNWQKTSLHSVREVRSFSYVEEFNDTLTYLWNPTGSTQTSIDVSPAQTTDYLVTVTNLYGCSLTDTVQLVVNQPTSGTDTQIAYDSYTWIDGNTYTQSTNTPTWTLTNAAGCDSTVTLNLTIISNTPGIDTRTACDSFTWIDGNTYTESTNTPTWTLTDASGHDSTVTLNLTIGHSTTGIDVQTTCNSYTWIDGVTYTESTNTPTITLTSAAGCDSTLTLNLTVVDASISIISLTPDFCDEYSAELSVETNMMNYMWSTGETSPTITVTQPGIYAVTATQDNCSLTAEYEIGACDFNIYLPNAITPGLDDGLNDYFCLQDQYKPLIDIFEIRIYNRWGELVYYSDDKDFKWDGSCQGRIKTNTVFTYQINFIDQRGVPYQITGTVTVL